MGGGHHEEIKIPDYKIYKVENCPELLAVQKALAARGLCDPWLRNEVWRFNPKEFGTESQRFWGLFFRGFKYGFAAFVVTAIGTKLLSSGDSHHHGHGDDHGSQEKHE